jgi:hypothetical protein
VRIEVALYVVWLREEFPWTVEIPSKFREGWYAEKRIANASWQFLAHRFFEREKQGLARIQENIEIFRRYEGGSTILIM